MTALLAMKYADLSQEVTISYTPEGLESSAVLCGFEQGDKDDAFEFAECSTYLFWK